MAHPGLPKPGVTRLSKSDLLERLAAVDHDDSARNRVLRMENEFRARIETHLNTLPTKDAQFSKFNTSPFVLMFYASQQSYSGIAELEKAIVPAKVFSSMETSAGRMVEQVVLPIYGWETVESGMHSPNSALDGRCLDTEVLRVATLKSGPRCLNDEMSENFADAVLSHFGYWASEAGADCVDFSYGVLYGTKKQSNKKDWHILRNIAEKLHGGDLLVPPAGKWECGFEKDGVRVDVTVRIGLDWWAHLGGDSDAFVELCVALVRACVAPSDVDREFDEYTIADLGEIVSLDSVPSDYNVSVLQRSQLEWFFFLARHFCDELVDSPSALGI